MGSWATGASWEKLRGGSIHGLGMDSSSLRMTISPLHWNESCAGGGRASFRGLSEEVMRISVTRPVEL